MPFMQYIELEYIIFLRHPYFGVQSQGQQEEVDSCLHRKEQNLFDFCCCPTVAV